jgi:putative transposase
MNYSTNLTDSQWQIIEKFFDNGRKRKHSLREIWNGILYVVKTGCQWRMLPNDFASWQTVYYYYRKWKYAGVYEIILDELNQLIRQREGKSMQPTACIIDSQSTKTTAVGGFQVGYDAGKKIKGRKRHIVVDTLGNLLKVEVHSAAKQDRDTAEAVLMQTHKKHRSIKAVFADGGYAGELEETIRQKLPLRLEIIRKMKDRFVVLPKRWIVERTFAWINNFRRNSKDYEFSPLSAEAIIQIAMISVSLNKLFK